MRIHGDDCRTRIEKEIAVKEPERFERVNQVLTKLASQEEGTQVDSALRESDEPDPVLKRARTRLEQSQQRQQQQQESSGSGITEEERKTARQEMRERERNNAEMNMSDEVIKKKKRATERER